jgi:hypothetical protein
LYINDLPAIINKPTLFADDISLILTAADHRQLKESFTYGLVSNQFFDIEYQ